MMKKKANRFIKRFNKRLENFNKRKNNKFNVNVSYGWSRIAPNENTTVEECLVEADKKMYQQKNEKKSLRKKANNDIN